MLQRRNNALSLGLLVFNSARLRTERDRTSKALVVKRAGQVRHTEDHNLNRTVALVRKRSNTARRHRGFQIGEDTTHRSPLNASTRRLT